MTRGGNREGAGRPSKDPGEKAKRATFALYPATIEAIKEGASRLGFSQAKLIDVAIGAYLASHPGESAPP